jgi:DNA-binding beta-propeller fold protein YncE
MAALGNNTLEIFDLKANRWTQSIGGLHHPQGVLYVPESQKLFVANAQGGQVVIYDGLSLQKVGAVDGLDDADNVRLDSVARQVYVGYGDGALAVLDAGDGKRLYDIKLDGHPESFQLEKSGPRVFVNVPSAGHIAVVDRKRKEVVARWPLGADGANFPMALDEANSRLFVACRKPPVVLVIDTKSGKTVARVDSPGDADDLWYDAAGKSLYVSGGEGLIGVTNQRGPDKYMALAKIPTASGARTSYWAPDLHRLYLAVPQRARQKAEVRVYETGP